MRQTRLWLHMVAVVALIVGVVPVSALAALCQPKSCAKKCCVVKSVKPGEAMSCHGSQAKSSKDKTLSDGVSKPGGCKCSISSKTSEPTEQVVPPAFGHKVPDVAATMPVASTDVNLPLGALVLAGVFASDSGPPQSQSSLPWLGRAPPVRLA